MLDAFRSNFKRVSNILQEGVDADGGYLVPEEYDRRLIDTLSEENIMRRLATIITTSGEHKINIAATKPAASWIEEGGALTFGDATFSQILLDAHKLHVAIKVTEELLYDNAFNLEGYILDQSERRWVMPKRTLSSTGTEPENRWASLQRPVVVRWPEP